MYRRAVVFGIHMIEFPVIAVSYELRSLPSWGWQCTGCWWCCWTSPVPLGDSSCETSDCCSREKDRNHVLQLILQCLPFILCLTSQLPCQQGTFPVYGRSLSSTVVRWRVDLNSRYLISTDLHVKFKVSDLFSFFCNNQVTHWIFLNQFSQQTNVSESGFVSRAI